MLMQGGIYNFSLLKISPDRKTTELNTQINNKTTKKVPILKVKKTRKKKEVKNIQQTLTIRQNTMKHLDLSSSIAMPHTPKQGHASEIKFQHKRRRPSTRQTQLEKAISCHFRKRNSENTFSIYTMRLV